MSTPLTHAQAIELVERLEDAEVLHPDVAHRLRAFLVDASEDGELLDWAEAQQVGATYLNLGDTKWEAWHHGTRFSAPTLRAALRAAKQEGER